MVLNRRAVFFSLSALFFVAVLLFVFTSSYSTESVNTGDIAVTVTNGYRQRLEQSYMPLLLRERSYATLYALSSDATQRDINLVLPSDYTQAIMTRQYRGNPLTITTLPEALGNLSNVSSETGVNVSIAVTDITVRQIGAFQALYEANYTYNLSSADGTVRFNRTISTYGTFYLYGLPDRYYNTQNPWSENLSFQSYRPRAWNTSEFKNMSDLRRYSTNNDSPSFFGRLTGDLSASPYGVEVTIPPAIAPADNLTSMDWQYFAGTGYECTYTHPGVYPALRLTFEDMVFYNLTGGSIAYDGGGCPDAP